MKISVCLASRGCIHSRTIESLMKQIKSIDCEIFISHDKPIPDAQNYLINKSLEYDWDYQLWLEEDVVMSDGLLADMICDFIEDRSIDIISVPYFLNGGSLSIQFFKSGGNKGKFRFSGMGCMLIRRTLLERVTERPFFSDKFAFKANHQDGSSLTEKNRIVYDPKGIRNVYALQDLYFWQLLMDAGAKPKFYSSTCDHYNFVESGKRETNKGCHIWEKIEPNIAELENYKEMVEKYASINK